MPEIALHTLRVNRRSLLLWSLALAATVLLYLAFYPSIHDNAAAYEKAIEGLPEALKRLSGGTGDIASPTGYLQGQFYATFGFILLMVFTVGRGARAIAGDEQAGLLELVMATPVSRERLVVERVAALTVEALVTGVVILLTLVILGPSFELGSIPFSNLVAATLSAVVGALVFGFAALAIGAVTGSRATALGLGSAIAAASFLYTTLSPLVSGLADHQAFSPCWQAFGYDPLTNGLDFGKFLVLLIEAAVLIAIALVGLARRDMR
jgi:ABC-2 type transport system permease protein